MGIVRRTRRCGDRQQIRPLGDCSQRIQLAPQFDQQCRKALCLRGGRILPVDIDAVEAVHLHELHARLGEVQQDRLVRDGRREVRGVRRAPDRDQDLQVRVLLLELAKLRKVDLVIRRIGGDAIARGSHVCECIDDMREPAGRDVGDVIVLRVDAP